jgi:hypothetical protein
LIGEPVAFTPGLGPHDEMSTLPEPPPLVLVAPAAADVAAPPLPVVAPPPPLLLLELLLPHPARAIRATTSIGASLHRRRGTRSPRLISPPRFRRCSSVSRPLS